MLELPVPGVCSVYSVSRDSDSDDAAINEMTEWSAEMDLHAGRVNVDGRFRRRWVVVVVVACSGRNWIYV